MKIPIVLFIGFLFVGVNIATAHEPHYVGNATRVTIIDPKVSKAYYGELTGQPAVYKIISTEEFPLYVSILSPNIVNAKKDYVVVVTDAEGKKYATLNDPPRAWEQWYEEFAGESYLKGPDYAATVPAGTYTITVSNPANTGAYVLAPGEVEAFTLVGTPGTIREIYSVKTKFFKKPWYSIFDGIIGKSLLGVLVVTAFLILGLVYLVLRWLRSKSRSY